MNTLVLTPLKKTTQRFFHTSSKRTMGWRIAGPSPKQLPVRSCHCCWLLVPSHCGGSIEIRRPLGPPLRPSTCRFLSPLPPWSKMAAPASLASSHSGRQEGRRRLRHHCARAPPRRGGEQDAEPPAGAPQGGRDVAAGQGGAARPAHPPQGAERGWVARPPRICGRPHVCRIPPGRHVALSSQRHSLWARGGRGSAFS